MPSKPRTDDVTREVVSRSIRDYFSTAKGQSLLKDYAKHIRRIETGKNHEGVPLEPDQIATSHRVIDNYVEIAETAILSKLTDAQTTAYKAQGFSIADILKLAGLIASAF